MRALITLALVAVGVHLAIRTVAALYRIIDLWYTIETEYPRVLRGVLGWGGGTALIWALLPGGLRTAFLLGWLGFVGLYLGLYAIRPVLARRREALPEQPAYHADPGT